MVKKTKIIWTKSSKDDLKIIYQYYFQFSKKIAKKIINTIINKTSILDISGFEKAGQIDEYNNNFRRLIVGNHKILYKELENHILIVRIFDCRQNPKKLIKITH